MEEKAVIHLYWEVRKGGQDVDNNQWHLEIGD